MRKAAIALILVTLTGCSFFNPKIPKQSAALAAETARRADLSSRNYNALLDLHDSSLMTWACCRERIARCVERERRSKGARLRAAATRCSLHRSTTRRWARTNARTRHSMARARV